MMYSENVIYRIKRFQNIYYSMLKKSLSVLFFQAVITLLLLGITGIAFAQQINYSEVLGADDRNINFEILGNMGNHTLIYKNKDRRHRLTLYDNNMKLVKDVELDFIANKTFNIDFVVYPYTSFKKVEMYIVTLQK